MARTTPKRAALILSRAPVHGYLDRSRRNLIDVEKVTNMDDSHNDEVHGAKEKESAKVDA